MKTPSLPIFGGMTQADVQSMTQAQRENLLNTLASGMRTAAPGSEKYAWQGQLLRLESMVMKVALVSDETKSEEN